MLQERFKHESTRMRGYELIYPCLDKTKLHSYDQMLKKSNEIFDEFTTGKKNQKESSKLKLS
jgi:hypothetical protein